MSCREKPKSSGNRHHIHHDGGTNGMLPRLPAVGEERAITTSEPHLGHRSSPLPTKSGFENDAAPPGPSTRDKPQTLTPSYIKWAESLSDLLTDSDGVKLFQKYLENEGPEHTKCLQFYFLCEGLNKAKASQDTIEKLVKCIYKKYFLKCVLPIDESLRKQIMEEMKYPQCLHPPITLFDEAQAQIKSLMNRTTYPNFLKSDVYLQYIQSVENPNSGSDVSSESGASISPPGNKDVSNLTSGIGPLPTLHEDMELNMNVQPPVFLTPGTGSVSTGYHTPNPRLTKDTLLKSQKHRVLDIRPKSEAFAGLVYRSNGVHIAYNSFNPVSRQDSEMQSLSSHSDARTESDSMSLHENSVEPKSGHSHEKQIRQLAARNRETDMNQTCIPRTLRRDWEGHGKMPSTAEEFAAHAALLNEKLEKVKRDLDTNKMLRMRLDWEGPIERPPPTSLEAALKEKLQFQDDSDQDILDEHVSRVFSDHSSQGVASPKTTSPPPRVGQWRRRRDRDLFSTFSGDSGNVHDFGSGEAFSRTPSSCRRPQVSSTADLPDSGISMVSEATGKENRVSSWLSKSDRSSGKVGGGHAHSEMGVGRKFKRYGSRSSSLERPTQPFIGDPNMPLLPHPNTDMQLEEIRRRLTEDDGRPRSKPRSSSKNYPDLAPSGQSTLKKSMRGQRPNLPQEEMTTAVFSFDDEQLPYRSKIPGTQITLRQFKDYLPKKGNFRFFFKTVCEDLYNQVTHEEVINDNEILPLWEGKVIAQMKPID